MITGPDQERTNENARIYVRITMDYLCKHNISELKKATTTMATRTSFNTRFNEKNNS